MRRQLTGAYRFARAHPTQIVSSAFYATAAGIVAWGLLVMLRGQLPDHADGLWVLSLAHDVLHGIPLQGWRLPGAPVYFPELFSVLVSGGLGFGVRASLLIYGAFSWLLMGGGIYWGLRLGRVSRARALRTALAALLVYVLLHCGSGLLLQPFEYPFSHGGVVLVSFFGLLYVAHGLERGFQLPSWLIAVLVLGLSCASDRAILAQFVAPALLVVLMFFALRAGPQRQLLWALGLLLLAPLIGQLVTVLIRWGVGIGPGGYTSRYGWVKSGRTLVRMCDDLQHLALERPSLAASVLVPVLFLAWRAFVAIRERVRSRSGLSGPSSVAPECWLACAGIAVLLSTLAAVVATNIWDGPASFRYLLPIFLLPLALGVITAAPSHLRVSDGWGRLLELTLLFVLVLVGTRTERRIPRRMATLDSPSRACLDSYLVEAGLQAGYAEYWSARPPMLLGQAGVTLAQVTGRLSPKWWADNRFWYTRGFSPGQERPRFSFVMTQKLDERWLGERFGAPHVEHHCFGYELWVYDRAEDVEFRNYLRSSVARATGDDSDWWSVVDSGRDEPDEPGTPDQLTFGGKKGVSVPLPRVRANVIEIVSPTRKPLKLSYRQEGTEVSLQEVTFSRDNRRLLAVPAGLEMRNIDTVFISGLPKVRYEVKRIALMWDPQAESARP